MSCCLACDGKSVLDQIKSVHLVLPTEPHANLLTAIRTKEQRSGIQIFWHHVQGHQGRKSITVLPRDAWLNVEADRLTKAKVDPAYHAPAQYQLLGEG